MGPVSRRLREIRRASRMVSWQVIRHPDTTLSRRTWLRLAIAKFRCGVITGGNHRWGPLRAEYEGQRLRRRKCRFCGAKMLPASEFDRQPPRGEHIAPRKPTEADTARAIQLARSRGLLKGDKWLWD